MTSKYSSLPLLMSALLLIMSCSQSKNAESTKSEEEIHKLENPITVKYLRNKLSKQSPRLVLNPKIEKNLKDKLQSDPVIKNMFAALKLNAADIVKEPLLERIKTGRRLLAVSRKFLYRMNVLGMVYRVERDPTILKRINEEVLAISNFTDWNPSHYLDVAEMALGLALAIDWAGEDLPIETVKAAKTALIEKGIKPSYNPDGNDGWINGSNNWNQVCHGGMIAASIVIAEEDPELATKTIHRALEGIPHALIEYGPDGVYPEGSTYWDYGTSFSVVTAAMLESAFGTDFGLGEFPAFKESAVFRILCNAPSGMYYNYADCGDSRSQDGDLTLAWFASKTGNRAFYEKERFLKAPSQMKKLGRLSGASLVWLSQVDNLSDSNIPKAWVGKGANPIAIFTGGPNDPSQFYFGAKGGRGTVNHGNMDGGSFILEMNGVRWVVDPGNQRYHDLEKTGFDLWNRSQKSQRWTLLTKNNFGHSTITVDGKMHVVDGMASITDFRKGPSPQVTIDMSPAFEGQLKFAARKFTKEGATSVLIEDQIEVLASTQLITWQLMTTADVELTSTGAILKQDGQKLIVSLLSHPEFMLSVIALDPPPLELDRTISGLKRLELRIPSYLLENKKGIVKVRLAAD